MGQSLCIKGAGNKEDLQFILQMKDNPKYLNYPEYKDSSLKEIEIKLDL